MSGLEVIQQEAESFLRNQSKQSRVASGDTLSQACNFLSEAFCYIGH